MFMANKTDYYFHISLSNAYLLEKKIISHYYDLSNGV